MIDFILESEIISQLIRKDSPIVVGVDEVGRGALAGPVVSAAVLFSDKSMTGLDDSKKLTALKRENLATEIASRAIVSIGIASVEEIDAMNIGCATRLSMERALNSLNVDIDLILVDGNQAPSVKWRTYCVIKGDNLCASIAAASIIAKVTRDRLMCELHQQYPCYHWEDNKGYGTKRHLDALLKFGASSHHRTTFAPVAKVCHTSKQTQDSTALHFL